MFTPRHIGWENCCYNSEVERAKAEASNERFVAERWKKEAEMWKAKYDQLDKRLKKIEVAITIICEEMGI